VSSVLTVVLDSHRSVIDKSIPIVTRSKARVCGLCLAGIAGSNPAGAMDVCC